MKEQVFSSLPKHVYRMEQEIYNGVTEKLSSYTWSEILIGDVTVFI